MKRVKIQDSFEGFLALSHDTILSLSQNDLAYRFELDEVIYILFSWKMNPSFSSYYAQD